MIDEGNSVIPILLLYLPSALWRLSDLTSFSTTVSSSSITRLSAILRPLLAVRLSAIRDPGHNDSQTSCQFRSQCNAQNHCLDSTRHRSSTFSGIIAPGPVEAIRSPLPIHLHISLSRFRLGLAPMSHTTNVGNCMEAAHGVFDVLSKVKPEIGMIDDATPALILTKTPVVYMRCI